MKKIAVIMLTLALLLIFNLRGVSQLTYGVKGGFNFNNINQNFKDASNEMDTKVLFSYHLGVIADYGIGEELSFQPGLFFIRKGYKLDMEEILQNEESFDGYNRVSLNYLEVPVNIAYKIRNFQVYGGPYLSANIGGKSKWDYSYEMNGFKVEDSDEMKVRPFLKEVESGDLDGDEQAVYALDYGLNIGVGFMRGPISVNTTYSNGFSNTTPRYKGSNIRKDFKQFNNGFHLSLTYFLMQ